MSDYSEQIKTIERIQQSIFPIICEISDFCRERGIRYYLCAGTCLGAVRHQGFIPWDYDADIMFPREDYERFVREYHAFSERKYEIGALDVDPEWKRQFGRVWDGDTVLRHKNLQDTEVGACVDIFPIDGFPTGNLSRKIFMKRMRILEALGYAASKTQYHEKERFKAVKKVLHFFLKPIGWRFFSARMNRLGKKCPMAGAKYCGVATAPEYGVREVMDSEVFADAVEMPFNGVPMLVPKEYDRYLTNLYGDYMSVPEGAKEHSYRQVDDWELIFKKD